ncbi:Fibroleukin,Angiopoietin-related protein 2,Angiopoietin-1 [Mytilus coruscus]|uniref:Fibroleukin,Angiopoietin-related protein 2,Angiopoietin-1 n=1 Tax=Mytilus coruscus TaxID=42192 RepID=A0A6J8CC53_MYTCO|nr:Fibroleukin,Angiopoietin-related protein 2,Angiopoietin-1 [Mytilus coruscus]
MTHRGQFEFNRLPYGLANSPATFNMMMDVVIRDLNWKSALVYVDDILIYSKNFKEHLCHLAALFDKLIEANLKLKPSKCQFACKKVRYLGHIITKGGIDVEPEKTASVQSFSAPKNIKEVIQRRLDGSTDFYRDWLDYKKGFGRVSGEYWIGNDKIFNILNGKSYSLRFDMERWSGEWRYAQYEIFKIADESEDYKLTLAGYTGTAGNAMQGNFSELIGLRFSTKDRDNDAWQGGHCADYMRSGWWYANNGWSDTLCTFVNPNGRYYMGTEDTLYARVYWYPWSNSYIGMRYVTMKIKLF